MAVNVLFTALTNPLDVNYLHWYDFSGYENIPLLIKIQNRTMVYFWRDVPEMLRTGNLADPFIESTNTLDIGFDELVWGGTTMIIPMENKPFYSYGNFVLESKIANGISKLNIFNLISQCCYEFKSHCSDNCPTWLIFNGCSLKHWDVFQLRKWEKSYLILIDKLSGISKTICLRKTQHLIFAQENQNNEIVFYLKNGGDEKYKWSTIHLFPNNQILHIPNNQLKNNVNHPRILQKEIIEDFAKRAVYQDLCLCGYYNLSQPSLYGTTVIFPKEHFNELFLTNLKNELLKYNNPRSIPNFLRIKP